MSEVIRDKYGREVRPGDLLRMFHYVDRRTKRNCYMHKLAVLVDDELKVSDTGRYLYGVDVTDIWAKNGIERAHKFKLASSDAIEIIDGLSRDTSDGLEVWYERPKVKPKEEAE